MADVNERLTGDEKVVAIKEAPTMQQGDGASKFKLTSKASLMQVNKSAYSDQSACS